jgi:DNA-binding MarR family transcriptional regulator
VNDPTAFESLCNVTAIRRASRRVTQFYDSALEPSGLRCTQLAILTRLARKESAPLTMRELAEALVLDRSALGHNLRPLLRDGFIVLRESPRDRRRSHVVLTPLGRAKTRAATKLWQGAQDRFEAGIGVAKSARIRKLMAYVADAELVGSAGK